MDRIAKLKIQLSDVPDLVPASPPEIDEIRRAYPGIPEEYLEFLKQIGSGCVDRLNLYSGPVTPDSIYDDYEEDGSDIILFGDDMMGYSSGFDISDGYSIVELDPTGAIESRTDDGFLTLVEQAMSEDE